ncbi:MAG: hypothetical protein ABMB14_31635 [Myxococcota bacterium]
MVTWWVALSGAARAQDAGADADPGAAGGRAVSFVDDFELRYWQLDQRLPDPADVPVFDYVEQVNRLNANATVGAWSFAAQIDEVALFGDRYYLDDVLYLERDLTTEGLPNVFGSGRLGDTAYANLEKVRATVEGDWGSLSLGDSYVAFGRGIALNLNRNVDIDIDTSVQGAKAVLRPGAWDITLVAGQANKQQVFQDNPNVLLQGDRRHLVAGVRAERFGLGPANLGAHAVVYDFVADPGFSASVEELEPFDVVAGGATAEVVGVGGVDAFVEGDVFGFGQNQPSPTDDAADVGYALYGSTSFYPGPFVVLIEGKRYDQSERINATLGPELYEIAVAPTLEYERVVTEDSSATLNSNDVYGGRVQVDWSAVPQKLVPYVAVAAFRDLDTGGAHFNDVPETIVHPTAGFEWLDGELAMLLNGGVRFDDRDGDTEGADRQAHGDLAFKFPLGGGLSGDVAIQAESFHWGVNALQQRDYFEAETSWGLAYKSAVALTAFVDTTTNPLVSTTGNVSGPVYAGGELQLKPGKATTLKLFYGAQKAGIRCSGGQCRQMPGFEGARLSAVGTF